MGEKVDFTPGETSCQLNSFRSWCGGQSATGMPKRMAIKIWSVVSMGQTATRSSSATSAIRILSFNCQIINFHWLSAFARIPAWQKGEKGETNHCLSEGWLAEPCCDIWQQIFYKALWAWAERLEFCGTLKDAHSRNNGILNIPWGSNYLGWGAWLSNCMVDILHHYNVWELDFSNWRAH